MNLYLVYLKTTRWTVRGESISSIVENYNVLKLLWDENLKSIFVRES